MALQRNRPGAMRRRVTAITVGGDLVIALVVGAVIGSLFGWIVFIIGLVAAGVLYYNMTQVMKTRGY